MGLSPEFAVKFEVKIFEEKAAAVSHMPVDGFKI